MINRPAVDMTRPTALYLGAAAVLLVATFVLGRLPMPSLAGLLGLPHQKAIAGAALCLSICAGLTGAQRHAARAQAPWRVPQSQALCLFTLFFFFGVLGLALSI